VRGYAHVIKEDTVDPNCFSSAPSSACGSVDGGQNWAQYKGSGFPGSGGARHRGASAHESDLVLATHGRGIWIIDDISPLRAAHGPVMTKDGGVPAGSRPVQQYG
jgi:hypothetical protein